MNKTELLTIACTLLRKNKNFDVSLVKVEFYVAYRHENIFEVDLKYKNKPVAIYLDERAFEDGNKVPGGGQTTFRPENWEDGSRDDKLILTMCWCIYNYCIEAVNGRPQTPPDKSLA